MTTECEVLGCEEKPWTMEFVDGKERWQCEKHYWESTSSIKLDGLPDDALISVNSSGRPIATVEDKDGTVRLVRLGEKPKQLVGNHYE